MHKRLLDQKVKAFNNASFIINDPISIPHQFTDSPNREIIGFWTAILSWGQRVTIINKSNELVQLMGGNPIDFILNHKPKDRKRFENFKHRTFNYTDTLYFLEFFQWYYRNHDSLESAFTFEGIETAENVEQSLVNFRALFFSLKNFPSRTMKHISSPTKKSTCKRINMFLRWMVRKDDCGVDFGIWNKIKPSQLCIPFDVHVERVARSLGLIQRKQKDWKTVLELTDALKKYDKEDPIKYDYALFGMGILEKNKI